MRFFCFAALTITSLSLCLAGTPAAARPETSTYIDGNITGVTPNSGGTLIFPNEKGMQFRTGLATLDVPYANITNAELGGKQIHPHNAPGSKLWALPSRLGSKTQPRCLVLEFKTEDE